MLLLTRFKSSKFMYPIYPHPQINFGINQVNEFVHDGDHIEKVAKVSHTRFSRITPCPNRTEGYRTEIAFHHYSLPGGGEYLLYS